jgi:hypothetical protein
MIDSVTVPLLQHSVVQCWDTLAWEWAAGDHRPVLGDEIRFMLMTLIGGFPFLPDRDTDFRHLRHWAAVIWDQVVTWST